MHDNHRVSTDLSLHVAERLYAADTLLARRERWGISYITLPATALPIYEPVLARLAST